MTWKSEMFSLKTGSDDDAMDDLDTKLLLSGKLRFHLHIYYTRRLKSSMFSTATLMLQAAPRQSIAPETTKLLV